MENFTECSKAVLREVVSCSPSVGWTTQNSLKNCRFNQIAFRLQNFRLNAWHLEMIQSTAHRLKRSDALWGGTGLRTHHYLNLPIENLTVCFIERFK